MGEETIAAPSEARLTPFVKCLWSFRSDRPATLPGIVVPDAHVEFVVHLGRPWAMASNDAPLATQPQMFLMAQSQGSLRFAPAGPSDLVAFRTNAAGAMALVGPRLAELWDTPVPLEELWGARARALHQELSAAATPRGRFRVLERFLTQAFAGTGGETLRSAQLLDETMLASSGARLGHIAARFGMGLRTMERRYSRFIGLPPQRVHTIARVLHACHLIRTARDLDLGAVAHRAGFYDHASFSNRFRELVGCSPSRFRAMEDVHYVELG